MSNRWVDELMPDQPMWVRDLVDEELRRKEASVERTARAFRACEQAREDQAALHRAEIERLQGAVVEAATQEGQRVATLCDALVRTAEHERNEARTEVERLRAVQRAFVRDNRDKTNAVRELEAEVEQLRADVRAYHEGQLELQHSLDEARVEVERLTEHIRERERVWSERERVAIKEAKRLNEALAKYEADDVRYLKDRAAWDAEAAELRAQAERLTNKLNTDSQCFQIECQKAEIEMLRAEVEQLTDQRDWHRVRNDALQKAQHHMRDPERKVVCDILANGTTYVEPFRAALEGGA